MSLGEIRAEIDEIDSGLVRLLVRRMRLADRVAEEKSRTGKAVADPVREAAVLDRAAAGAGEFAEDAREMMSVLMARSRARQTSRLAVSPCRGSGEGGAAFTPVIGIRGMGLIGGSFEKAFAAIGCEVRDLKMADSAMIGGCDFVIVCLPPLMVAPWIREHAGDFAEGAIITDAAGVKTTVCAELGDIAKSARWTYVGGHPMAGKERSGYANSDGALYRGASMILTPYEWTPPEAVERLKALFSRIGFARFVVADPRRHDEMIAYTSQLAHVVSSAYARDALARDHVGFSAGSFQDMTRVATVDPDIWTDLFLSNRESLEAVLTRLIERLGEYRDAIGSRDAATLRTLLAEGRAAKEASK